VSIRPLRLPFSLAPLIRIFDASVVVVAGLLALELRRVLEVPLDFPKELSRYYGLISAAALLFVFVSSKDQRSWRGSHMVSMLASVAGRWLLVSVLLLLWLFLFKASQDFSRIWFLVWVMLGILLLWLVRFIVYLLLRLIRQKGFNLKHVLLIGSGALAEQIQSRILEAGWSGYKILLTVPEINASTLSGLTEADVDEVWLALPLGDEAGIRETLHALRHSTASIRFAPDLFTLRLINHGVSDVLGVTMFDLSTSPMTGVNQLVKWLEDKVLSSLILLLISPLMILLALGVKLTSPGPVFYRQERVGLNNKPFHMLKFRSMPVDTEKSGVQWGGSAAKATTRFGQFIRKTSLDELPQFLNVLKGDMSIVGPRPERPMFVEQFKEEIPDYMKKHMVKAGITGWAQVHGWRGDTDLKTRIEYDLYYIENWSFWLDLKIVLMTIFKGFVNKNAY
jgi:putative colanic acid biosynthesis UDP-glucose lipid carrier transferase